MAHGSDSGKVAEWRRRMARFDGARGTVRQFCQDEGVSVPSFYHWRKKLRQPTSNSEEANNTSVRFAPVQLVGSGHVSVSVRLPGGTQLDVPTGDREVLQTAIRTLVQADAERIAGAEAC